MFIKIAMLVVFFGIMVVVGIYCKKHTTDVNGFVLGGRAVGPWLSAFAYGTSYFSAVIFIGYAGQFGWKFGVASTWIGIGNALIGSLLAWTILGRRTRLMTHHLDSATMPEFFGKRYLSGKLKVSSSAIIFIFLIPYTASLFNGLSRLFGMAFNIDYTVCIIGMAVLTGIYVVVGGYMATAVNDFIQGCIMLVGIVLVILSILNQNGGFLASIHELSKVSDPLVSESPGIFASFFGPDPVSLLTVLILTSLGTWGLPQMVQKFYAIKNEAAIDKGTVISTVFALVVAGGCYFLGGFGRLFGHQINVAEVGYDAIIPKMLESLPEILIAVVVILVLSASMSTLSALVLASSSTLTLDFLKDNFIKNMTQKSQVTTMRLLIVLFIAISSGIAIMQYKSSVVFIAQLMGISWGALAGAFLAPFLYGLYWKGVTSIAVACNFVFGVGLMVLNLLFRSSFPLLLQSPINCGAFAMMAGLIIVPLVSVLTPKFSRDHTDKMFSCYEEHVVVSVKQALGD